MEKEILIRNLDSIDPKWNIRNELVYERALKLLAHYIDDPEITKTVESIISDRS